MVHRPKRDPVGPGRESVWHYPRPPALVASDHHVRVTYLGLVLAESRKPWRILETAHAPAYYIAAADVAGHYLEPSSTRTVCEYKGVASYADLVVPDGRRLRDVCWWYAQPTPAYSALAGAICFYPQKVQCSVNGEAVTPLPDSFYGDWPTSWIVGPYKGGPGTQWW